MRVVLVVVLVSVAVVDAVVISRAVVRIRLERALRAHPLWVNDPRVGTHGRTGFRWLAQSDGDARAGRHSGTGE
jgi:hypothetical protein